MKKILTIALVVLIGIYALGGNQQHSRLYYAMSAVVNNAIYSANAIFVQNLSGTRSWTDSSLWQSSALPVLNPSVNTSITFFPTTNTVLIGTITINNDPANVVINTININGGG